MPKLTTSPADVYAATQAALKKPVEEPKDDPDDDPADDPVDDPEPEVEESALEAAARLKGHVSKEEWIEQGKPEEEWRTAREFLDRGELLDSLHNARREIKGLQTQLNTLAEHNANLDKAAYDKAYKTVKDEFEAAAAEGNVADMLSAQNKMEEIKNAATKVEEKHATATAPVTETPEAIFAEWAAQPENAWFHTDPQMKAIATGWGYQIEADNPGIELREVLSEVNKRMQEMFPDRTSGNVRRAAPAAVTKTKTRSTPKSKDKLPSYEELTPEAQIVYKRLVKSSDNPHGVLTHEKYMKDYVAAKAKV